MANKIPENIYIMLKSIYNYNRKDVIVAFDLFNELCIPINEEFFNKYFYDRLKEYDEYTKFKNVHMYHNYFTNEESKMNINKSHIRIKSTLENNIFLTNIKDLTDLFVCDFINDNYDYLKSKNYVLKGSKDK